MNGSSGSLLSCAQSGDVLQVELRRPDRANALSEALVQQLRGVVETSRLPVLAITAAGRDFCSGFDLRDSDDRGDYELAARFIAVELMLEAICLYPGLTLAHAHGRAWGAGADLLLACDERWADADATFRFPGPSFGLVLGTRRLAQRIGSGPAASLVMSNRVIGAAEALHLGLIDRIGSRSEFDEHLKSARDASCVDAVTLRELRSRLACSGSDDLAALVRSAFRPGLKDRIAAYRQTLKQTKQETQ